MSGKFRRMIIIMLISISMILLVSCGTMEVSTNVKVNKDGSSNTVFRLVYDESIKKVVGDGLLQQVLGTETEINVYSQDNNIYIFLQHNSSLFSLTHNYNFNFS